MSLNVIFLKSSLDREKEKDGIDETKEINEKVIGNINHSVLNLFYYKNISITERTMIFSLSSRKILQEGNILLLTGNEKFKYTGLSDPNLELYNIKFHRSYNENKNFLSSIREDSLIKNYIIHNYKIDKDDNDNQCNNEIEYNIIVNLINYGVKEGEISIGVISLGNFEYDIIEITKSGLKDIEGTKDIEEMKETEGINQGNKYFTTLDCMKILVGHIHEEINIIVETVGEIDRKEKADDVDNLGKEKKDNNLHIQYRFDTLIPIGEDCAAGLILRDSGLRKESFPFDWSNITLEYIVKIMKEKLHLDREDVSDKDQNLNIEELVKWHYDESATLEKRVSLNGVSFFHESGNVEEIRQKYTRRFKRLIKTLRTGKRVLLIHITRFDPINKNMDSIVSLLKILQKYNSQSKLIYISGSREDNDFYNVGIDKDNDKKDINILYKPQRIIEILNREGIKEENFLCKYVYYDKSQYWNFDYTYFRPKILEYLSSILSKE